MMIRGGVLLDYNQVLSCLLSCLICLRRLFQGVASFSAYAQDLSRSYMAESDQDR